MGRRCEQIGCVIHPTFNHEGQSTPLYCKTHALSGMVDIKGRRCQHAGCVIHPAFNYEGQSKPLYCKGHAITSMVNIKNRRCEYPECTKQPGSGISGYRPTHCAEHRTDGMIARPLRRCEQCKSFALYGMNSTPTHCETHKSPQHRNLVQYNCANCGVFEYVDNEKKCGVCSDYLKKNLKLRKQRQVKMWLDSHDHLKTYQIYDRQLESGVCGKERPDFAWDCQTHFVILEVDEFKHYTRLRECEQIRMVNMTSTLGMPCLWVRFNPDDFQGKKSSLTERDRRELLEKWLVECQRFTPTGIEDFCRVSYLYFDGFQVGQPVSIEKISMQ